jgi:hypothetical protein
MLHKWNTLKRKMGSYTHLPRNLPNIKEMIKKWTMEK